MPAAKSSFMVNLSWKSASEIISQMHDWPIVEEQGNKYDGDGYLSAHLLTHVTQWKP